MKNNSIRKISMLSSLIDLTVFYVLFMLLNWNFIIAFIVSEIVGWGVRYAWRQATADEEKARGLIELADRYWWVPILVLLGLVFLVVMTGPGHLTRLDYFYGEIFLGIILIYTGAFEWDEHKKGRAVLLFIAAIFWFLLSLDMFMYGESGNDAIKRLQTLEITTAIPLFITLCLSLIAFAGFLLDSLRLRRPAHG